MDGWKTTFLLGRPLFRGELLVLASVHVGSVAPFAPFLRSGDGRQVQCRKVSVKDVPIV